MNHWPKGKPPRYYAGAIIRLRPDLRNEALSRVPGELQNWVLDLVNSHFAKQNKPDRVGNCHDNSKSESETNNTAVV